MEKRNLLSLFVALCLIAMNFAGCMIPGLGNETTEPTVTDPTTTEPTATEPTVTEPTVTEPDVPAFPTIDPSEVLDYFTYRVVDGKAAITGFKQEFSGNITLPDTIDGYPVTAIDNVAFEACQQLTGVVIPEGVIGIGWHAFENCPQLTDIFISSSVEIIDERVFENCGNLKGIWVDEKNPAFNSDGYGVLFNKENTVLVAAPGAIEVYTIPGSVERIENYAFNYNKNLRSIEIPDSVTSIGWAAFNGCKNLTSVTIPGSVTNIDVCAFGTCRDLTTVVICEGVTNLSEYIFGDCMNLTSVTIPASVTNIDKEAFFECSKLQTVYFGGSEADWEAITIGADNDYLLGATVVYNYTVPTNS